MTMMALSGGKIKNDMLPLMMAGGGDFASNPMAMMALSGNKIKSNNMLPLMMAGGGDFASNPMAMMALSGNKIKSNNMLPLMMAGGSSGFASNPMAMMALSGGKMKNDMLPFLMMDSFGNTYTTAGAAPSMLSNPVALASVTGNKLKAGRAMSNEQLLLMSGGLSGGLNNPFALSALTGDKKFNVADAYSMGADIGLMAASGNLKNFDVSSKDMTLPMVVNQMAAGRGAGRVSLRRDVLPAMALTGEDIEMETILPWMMTQGQHYLGGQFGEMLPFLDNKEFKRAFKSDNLMPWLVSDMGPVATRVPYLG